MHLRLLYKRLSDRGAFGLITYKTKLKLDREAGDGDLSELKNCKRLINKLTEVLIRLMWLI